MAGPVNGSMDYLQCSGGFILAQMEIRHHPQGSKAHFGRLEVCGGAEGHRRDLRGGGLCPLPRGGAAGPSQFGSLVTHGGLINIPFGQKVDLPI